MTNAKLLRETIIKSGIKYKYIADYLGLSAFGLQKKIDNINEFKASEIVKISQLLNLSDKKRDKIFFAEQVNINHFCGGEDSGNRE